MPLIICIPIFLDQLSRSIRSSDKVHKLKEHCWKLKSKGSRSFSVAAPQYWYSLSDDISVISNWTSMSIRNDSKHFCLKVLFLLEQCISSFNLINRANAPKVKIWYTYEITMYVNMCEDVPNYPTRWIIRGYTLV